MAYLLDDETFERLRRLLRQVGGGLSHMIGQTTPVRTLTNPVYGKIIGKPADREYQVEIIEKGDTPGSWVSTGVTVKAKELQDSNTNVHVSSNKIVILYWGWEEKDDELGWYFDLVMTDEPDSSRYKLSASGTSTQQLNCP